MGLVERTRAMHRIEVRVRFGETDPFGVATFTSFLEYAKTALDEYLRGLGLPPAQFYRNASGGWPIGEVAARYEAPARYDERLMVSIAVAEVGRSRVRFAFQVQRANDGRRLANGAITCVAIGPRWRARPIPADLVALFEKERKRTS
jgi:YbgC/YbaW family acyl-CoA thioester hydrolase